MLVPSYQELNQLNSAVHILVYTAKVSDFPAGLEAVDFAKSNRLLTTYTLLQKIWNRTKQLQRVTGFT